MKTHFLSALAMGAVLAAGGWTHSAKAQRDVRRTVHCRSDGHRYNECNAAGTHGEIIDVQVSRRISDAECRHNRTFGVTNDGRRIWVDKGCEAEFNVLVVDRSGYYPPPYPPSYPPTYPPTYPPYPPRPPVSHATPVYVSCSSIRDLSIECAIPARGRLLGARLLRQHSNSTCAQGYTWGLDHYRHTIWVTRGCRGDFEVLVDSYNRW